MDKPPARPRLQHFKQLLCTVVAGDALHAACRRHDDGQSQPMREAGQLKSSKWKRETRFCSSGQQTRLFSCSRRESSVADVCLSRMSRTKLQCLESVGGCAATCSVMGLCECRAHQPRAVHPSHTPKCTNHHEQSRTRNSLPWRGSCFPGSLISDAHACWPRFSTDLLPLLR